MPIGGWNEDTVVEYLDDTLGRGGDPAVDADDDEFEEA